MRSVISLGLILTVLFGSSVPTFAQSRTTATSKTQASDASTRFTSVRAITDGSGVLVEWEMAVEVDNAGFYVYRTDAGGSQVVLQDMVLSRSMSQSIRRPAGERYSMFDPEGTANSSYQIATVQLDGGSTASNTLVPESVSDLRSAGFQSSRELGKQVRDGKKNSLVISNKLEIPRTMVKEVVLNQLANNPTTHRWVISQPGVKIGVRSEGFHRVTKSQLQAAGFDVNGNSAMWQLYVGGVEQAMTVASNADYIEFYGSGTDTPETDIRTYYLVTGPAAGKRIGTRSARPAAGTVTSPSYSQTFVLKQRVYYINGILNGDADNYFGTPVSASALPAVNFTLDAVDFTSPNASLDLKFQGYSFDNHIVQVTLNGEVLAPATGSSREPFSKSYAIPTAFLREGANSIQFRATGPAGDFSFFDTMSIGFARGFKAKQNQVAFSTQNSRMAKLAGFTSPNVRVFDMTNANEPIQLSNLNVVQDGAAFGITMPADRGRVMFAAEDSAFKPAVSVAANDPALLSVPDHAARLLIITYKDFLPQAEAWANYRRGQGITVKVVEVTEIFDEFNYGTLSADSIKSFVQYAYQNWQTAPGYLLLLGDASYDARNYEGTGFANLVPTKIVNTIFSEAGSDDTFADFNNDGLSEMAVGRIPARTGQEITNALAKVTSYEQAIPLMANRGVLFAYDSYDAANNYDFQAISARIRTQLPVSTPVTMIGRSDVTTPPATPQSLLISSMNTGKYIVNYSGHGATGTWAVASFFTSSNVPQLTNANNLSIFTMLTCLNGLFLQPVNKSLAENLVDSTSGGAVAAWASTGETTPDVQEIMATRFFSRLSIGQIERMGDLINDAKATIPGGVDVRLSWALIGDPMLKVRTAPIGDRPEQ